MPASLCLDRKYYSNEKIAKLINKVKKIKGDSRFVIQADGVPMSGGEDSLNSTLQAVAMAVSEDFGNLYTFVGRNQFKNRKTCKRMRLALQRSGCRVLCKENYQKSAS